MVSQVSLLWNEGIMFHQYVKHKFCFHYGSLLLQESFKLILNLECRCSFPHSSTIVINSHLAPAAYNGPVTGIALMDLNYL